MTANPKHLPTVTLYDSAYRDGSHYRLLWRSSASTQLGMALVSAVMALRPRAAAPASLVWEVIHLHTNQNLKHSKVSKLKFLENSKHLQLINWFLQMPRNNHRVFPKVTKKWLKVQKIISKNLNASL